jgi:ATP-dependent protease ClpP protease subunit
VRPLGVGVLKLEITAEIDAAMAGMVARAVATYPGHSIEVAIDTIGGDWNASCWIFTSLENHARRVTAFIIMAASGGALVAMGADLRRLHPAGHFFLHRPHGNFPEARIDEIANAKATLMASRCRIPAARIRRWMDEETTIHAARALSYGLVDEVPGLPKPKLPVVFL